MTSAGEPAIRAMSLDTRKTPVPIVSPITIAVAAQRPRPRTSPLCFECGCGSPGIESGTQSVLVARCWVNQRGFHRANTLVWGEMRPRFIST